MLTAVTTGHLRLIAGEGVGGWRVQGKNWGSGDEIGVEMRGRRSV